MREIPLTKGKVALLDDADFGAVGGLRWYANRLGDNWYAYRRVRTPDGGSQIRSMHSYLTGFREVDHRDHNGLNNQRANLREVTRSQNLMNQRPRGGASQFKGVAWHNQACKWQAGIRIDGRRRYLGLYESEVDAALAYDRAAHELFGEYAHPNFPSTDLPKAG
jgi:hypothetical protein